MDGRWFRAVIALASLPVAGLSLYNSLINIAAASPASQLLSQWNGDPRLRVERAYQAALANLDQPPLFNASLIADAKIVLRDSPLNSHALWLVAMGYPAGSRQRIRGLMLAEDANRQDFAVGMQLTKEYASLGDSKTAMTHLDRILVAYAPQTSTLLQYLGGGLTDPALRSILPAYRDRAWFQQLLNIMMTQSADPNGAADLLLASGLTDKKFPPVYHSVLLQKLLSVGAYEKAAAVAIRFGWKPFSDTDSWAFSDETTDQRFAPLNWRFSVEPERSVRLVGNGQIEIDLAPNSSGEVISKYSSLPPGSYTLTLNGDVAQGSAGGTLAMTISCVKVGQLDLVLKHDLSAVSNGHPAKVQLSIPRDCIHQYWQFSASAGEGSLPGKITFGPFKVLRN